MTRFALCLLCALLILPASSAWAEGAGTLTVAPEQVVAEMSPTLYGLFFEDINHAADGGLYAELLNNRSFEYENLLNPQRFDHYTGWTFRFLSAGKGKIALMDESPLNGNNPHYVHVTVQEPGYTVANGGYGATAIAGGIALRGGEGYDLSLHLRSAGFDGSVTACLCLRTGEKLSNEVTFTPAASGRSRRAC